MIYVAYWIALVLVLTFMIRRAYNIIAEDLGGPWKVIKKKPKNDMDVY